MNGVGSLVPLELLMGCFNFFMGQMAFLHGSFCLAHGAILNWSRSTLAHSTATIPFQYGYSQLCLRLPHLNFRWRCTTKDIQDTKDAKDTTPSLSSFTSLLSFHPNNIAYPYGISTSILGGPRFVAAYDTDAPPSHSVSPHQY